MGSSVIACFSPIGGFAWFLAMAFGSHVFNLQSSGFHDEIEPSTLYLDSFDGCYTARECSCAQLYGPLFGFDIADISKVY